MIQSLSSVENFIPSLKQRTGFGQCVRPAGPIDNELHHVFKDPFRESQLAH